jgi:hypothetical protein
VDHLGLRVVYAGVNRQYRDTGGGDVWLRLRLRADVDKAVVERAVEVANGPAFAGTAEVLVSFVSPTPGGWSFGIVDAESLAALRSCVARLADELERAGVTGVLDAVPPVRLPAFAAGSGGPPEPAAFVFWLLDLEAMTADPQRNPHWFVPDSAAVPLAQAAADFARPVPGSTILTQGVYSMRADPEVVAEGLLRGVTHAITAGVDVLDGDSKSRHVAWCANGHGVYQVIGEPDWTIKVEQLRNLLVTLPDAAAIGFVRPAFRGALGVQAVHQAQALPTLHEADVRYNPHLLDRYAPDAHGIQVLTDRHLEHGPDLDGWIVTDLGSGRHLVEAADLEPWYAKPLPEPDVVTAARTAFAPTLLTEEIIKTNLPPWWQPLLYP